MSNESIIQQNNETMLRFLQLREIPEKYRLKDKIPEGFIYCIENTKNGKKYIGSTYSVWAGVQKPTLYSSMHKRASMYLYEYNRACRNNISNVTTTYRPIIRAFMQEGFNNFIMYPICECTKSNIREMEEYFINTYDTIKSGYNSSKPINVLYREHIKPMSEAQKKLRSTGVLCINLNEKKMLISDSMKLFADYLGTKKDLIKNSNRSGTTYKNWFIFYLDKSKRDYILHEIILNPNYNGRRKYSDSHKQLYSNLSKSVDEYLSGHTEYFSDFIKLDNLVYNV